jgi:hypothetical protein
MTNRIQQSWKLQQKQGLLNHYDNSNIVRTRLNDTNDRVSLQEAKQTSDAVSQHRFEARASALLADLDNRLVRLETAGDEQNKINKVTLLSIVTADNNNNKETLTQDLGQHINTKIRTQKTEKQNRDHEKADVAERMEFPSGMITNLEDRAQSSNRKTQDFLY